ncbi:DUF4157 domain-containing protein [Microcoleus sp. FACHB-1515]|uniref:eCIS core domain-containing protein n=1 Tax=Cyanophyceae TaxID=3028117 RepID=UPI00168343E6|nr:DUF4157 domain-containing protein [Microcoleus sp. FACHB-1515]MBD2089949.1 DUF4157 domain-containing protein [Microcoleus sp. FACHB-1515]
MSSSKVSQRKESAQSSLQKLPATQHETVSSQPYDSILAMQQAVGNQAVNQQLQGDRSTVEADVTAPFIQAGMRSPGHPLDTATRALMESRFGQDFSQVRIHTDAQVAESVQQANALAYTMHQNIVFAPGQYAPETEAGRRLLVHELTHVVQQSQSSSSLPGDTHEQEAEIAAGRSPSAEISVSHFSAAGVPQLAGDPAKAGQKPRLIFLDTNVVLDIEAGNTQAETRLAELRKEGAIFKLPQQVYNELVVQAADPKSREATLKTLERLGLNLGETGFFAERVDVYDRNIRDISPEGGGSIRTFQANKKELPQPRAILSEPDLLLERRKGTRNDVLVAAQVKAAGGELWTFDRDYLASNKQGVTGAKPEVTDPKRGLGVKIAPESWQIPMVRTSGGSGGGGKGSSQPKASPAAGASSLPAPAPTMPPPTALPKAPPVAPLTPPSLGDAPLPQGGTGSASLAAPKGDRPAAPRAPQLPIPSPGASTPVKPELPGSTTKSPLRLGPGPEGGISAGKSSSSTGRLTATVGTPTPAPKGLDSPPKGAKPQAIEFGPSARGDAMAQGIVFGLELLRNGLNRLAAENQMTAAQSAIAVEKPKIYQTLFDNPGMGMLIQVHFVQSQDNPVPMFKGITSVMAASREEASKIPTIRQGYESGSTESSMILWYPPVRKKPASKTAEQADKPSEKAPPLIVHTVEEFIKALPDPFKYQQVYDALKQTQPTFPGYTISIGGVNLLLPVDIHTTALAFYEKKIQEDLTANLNALTEAIRVNESRLQKNLKEGAISKWWHGKIDLDPHMFDYPKAHAASAKIGIERKAFRDVRASLKAGWDLVEIAHKELHKFETGVDLDM